MPSSPVRARPRAARPASLAEVADAIVACRRCPRLVHHLAAVGARKKREFAAWTYWARPVPGLGAEDARLVVVGLAPAAHGAARTGRVFTGDSSAAFLYRSLHRFGFASRPTSMTSDDGLVVRDLYVTLAGRCAPPENKPTPDELARCRPFLVDELRLLGRARVVVALGRIAWDAVLRAAPEAGLRLDAGAPAFGHGARARLDGDGGRVVDLLGSYHPSRQNTQTGRLTAAMLDAIFAQARRLVDAPAL